MTDSYLAARVVSKAFDIVKTAFLDTANKGISRDSSIHIVVMDPSKPYSPDADFFGSVLIEGSIGTPKAEYIGFARSKARISWKYKLYSQAVQQLYPHLLEENMTIWGGGVYLHETASGASGVQYQLDQWVAEMMIITIRAFCVTEMREIVKDGNINYLGTTNI